MQFKHIYLLIEDSTMPQFTYRSGNMGGFTRATNLTYFVGLEDSGMQLIVLQVTDNSLHLAEKYLQYLKSQNLVDRAAQLVKAEFYVYEQSRYVS